MHAFPVFLLTSLAFGQPAAADNPAAIARQILDDSQPADKRQQLAAEQAGRPGEIVAALEAGGYLSSTLIIVTADHGGHGMGHGDDSPEDRTIPWLATGPGVPPGLTLTRRVNTFDTAATAAYALKLPLPSNWDGRPVMEIFPAGQVVASSQ